MWDLLAKLKYTLLQKKWKQYAHVDFIYSNEEKAVAASSFFKKKLGKDPWKEHCLLIVLGPG